MKRKHHGTDEVIRKVREAELLEGSGQTVGQVCQKLEISEQALNRWRKQFRGMGDDHIKRLKDLEDENRRLKKLVADQALGACGRSLRLGDNDRRWPDKPVFDGLKHPQPCLKHPQP